jgi:hypothetical protein
LQHKIGMNCVVKPGLTEDLYSVKWKLFSIILHMWYIHLTNIKTIHKRQTLPARVKLSEKKILVMSVKQLGTKMNWLVVNHQSFSSLAQTKVHPLSCIKLSIRNVLGFLWRKWKPYPRAVFHKSRLV